MLPIAPLSKIIEIIQIIINGKFAYLAELRKNKLQLFPFFHMGVKIADHLFHKDGRQTMMLHVRVYCQIDHMKSFCCMKLGSPAGIQIVFSLDEFPQFWNILKGDMSIVGNRPLPLYEAELLTTDEYIERFMAPSGLTGLWQVEKRGDQGTLSAEERKQLDIKYARNFSFGNDIKIICKTFTAFVQKENV